MAEPQNSGRLGRATAGLSIYLYLSYRDYLSDLYDRIKAQEEQYNYNEFAADLGFSKSNVLWLVVSGKRRLSEMTTGRILAHSHFDREEQKYFRLLVKHNNTRDAVKRDELLAALLALKAENALNDEAKENLEYFSEWYHPAIREMAAMDDFQSDPKWIADHMHRRLLPKQVEKSLQLLEDLKLIRYDRKQRRHISTSEPISPDREVNDHAAMRFHQQMCELAAQSLSETPQEDREYNTLTIAVSEQEAAEIKNMLYELCQKIVKIERRARKKNRTFQINLQLFPLSVAAKRGRK